MKKQILYPLIVGVGTLLIGYYVFGIGKIDVVEREVINYASQTIENSPGSTNVQAVVNLKDQPRILSQEIKDDILSQFKSKGVDKTKKIQIVAISGDGEAYNYASSIMDFLTNEGYVVEGVARDFNPSSLLSVGFHFYLVPNTKDLYEIYVGSKS